MKKQIFKNPLIGGIFFVLFVITAIYTKGRFEGWANYLSQILVIAELFLALQFTFNFGRKKEHKGLVKSKAASLLVFLVLIPATILAGTHFFGDRGYYLMSVLIVIEALIPFFVFYEKKKLNIKQLVIISVICAFAVIGRIIFFALPQFKPTAAIIMIAGVCFGGETGFLCGALSAFLSNIYYGQGIWTLWQMAAMGALGAVSGVLVSKGWIHRDRLSLSVFGALAIFIIYGFILNTSGVIMYNDYPTAEMFISAYVMGFPFDLIHAVSTAFFMWFMAEPLEEKLERIIIKYDL